MRFIRNSFPPPNTRIYIYIYVCVCVCVYVEIVKRTYISISMYIYVVSSFFLYHLKAFRHERMWTITKFQSSLVFHGSLVFLKSGLIPWLLYLLLISSSFRASSRSDSEGFQPIQRRIFPISFTEILPFRLISNILKASRNSELKKRKRKLLNKW